MMVKISDYSKLINLLPVNHTSFKILKKNWRSNQTLVGKIFNDKDHVIISKKDLKSEQAEINVFIIKTLMWGYPTKGRGNNIENLINQNSLDNIGKVLSKYKINPHQTFQNIITDFYHLKKEGVKGLGISTFSKFLYLLNVKIEGYDALILDDRIINIINENNFQELKCLFGIARDDAFKIHSKNNYLEYLKIINKIAYDNNSKPENIEMFIYFFGKNLH